MFQKLLVIDCRGHLMGRLASIVAKELLNGQRVVCVRTEALNISGSFPRNKVKYLAFLRKRCNVNPTKGPLHFRAPSAIFKRCIRGMIPHKTARGALALKKLIAVEGIPTTYVHKKRMVVPEAMRVLRLRPGRRFCQLERLSIEFGWKHSEAVRRLETQRKAKSATWYQREKTLKKLRGRAVEQINKKKVAPKKAVKGTKQAKSVTPAQARQLVNHGHITVNNKVVDIPSFQCRLNDLISVKNNGNSKNLVENNLKNAQVNDIPAHLKFDNSKLEATILDYCDRNDLALQLDELLVIEHYSRR